MNKPLILIGYRATGKSTVAAELAQKICASWIDSDAVIVSTAGMPITAFFAQHGEIAFRDLEESVIADLLNTDNANNQIIATGGGAILRATTRKLLRQCGFVIWLTATPDTIIERMNADSATLQNRPPLTSLSQYDEIISLLTARNQLYQETAHHTIATDNITISDIVSNIVSLVACQNT